MVTSYQGDELEAIRIGATCQRKQTFLQKTYICLWTAKQQYKPLEQNHKNYHDITVSEIRRNLRNISHSIKSIKFVYCPAHTQGNSWKWNSWQTGKNSSKKSTNPREPTYIVSSSEIKTENKKITLSKWQRRLNNTKDNKYKNIIPTISKEELKQDAELGVSKIIRLKSGYCMLKSLRSKIDLKITPGCDHCKVKETPSHLLLHCKIFDGERHKPTKAVYMKFSIQTRQPSRKLWPGY